MFQPVNNIILAALLLVILATLSATATDIRTVGNRRIDLDALGTNSPWRTLHIKAIASGGAFAKATVRVEGETKVIHVKNLPAAITKTFAEPIRLAAEVVKLENYITGETARLRRLSANIPATAVSGSSGDVAITSYNNALVNLEERRDYLEKLRERLSAANAVAQKSTERAYFTGQKYAGLEVWDCGVKVGN